MPEQDFGCLRIHLTTVTSIGETAPESHVWHVPAAIVGLGMAAALSLVWLMLPPTGSDLSAQVAHARFAGAHLWHPMDLQWFGGASWLGYSVLVPPLMAAVGVRLVGVLATVASAALVGLLMSRSAVPRPRAGAVAGALCLFANLVVGRLTFAVGIASSLATLIALTSKHPLRWLVLLVGPLITWAASPLAALFLGLVGVTLVLQRRGGRDGLVLSSAALAALAGSVWMGPAGYMPAPLGKGVAGVLACCVLAFATRYRLIRIGAFLAAAGIVLSLSVHTQVGMNAVRLPELFAAPLAVATSRLKARMFVPAVALLVCMVPPLTADDVTAIGEPSNQRFYYAGLVTELDRLPLSGRVEIPPTLQRWESVYAAARIPLARGWMTQLDEGYDPLFFGPVIDPTAYRKWLHDNAVQYVAVPDARLAEAGSVEATLINAGVPYLHELWSGRHWTVYSVKHATATVTGGRLVSQGAVSVSFHVPAAATVAVRVRWSQWLTLTGPDACLRPHHTWTEVVVQQPGTYRIGSAVLPDDRHRQCPDL